MRYLTSMIILAFCLSFGGGALALDLRPYFPDSNTVYLNKKDGSFHSRYTFTKAPPGFKGLYDQFLTLNKPGAHYTWRKEYWKNESWCTATYAVLFMGDDMSVTEVGDWYASTPCTPNVAFGYKTSAGVNSGLIWSPPGGLTQIPAVVDALNTASQATPGAAYVTNGYQAYSKTGLIEVLPQYTLPFGNADGSGWASGNGRTFQNVAHIVMYHGTRPPTPTPIRCDIPPIAANGAYYQSFKNYNSYAIELWLAEGVGIIQENTPFIEDGGYWGISNCSGGQFSPPFMWSSFIQ